MLVPGLVQTINGPMATAQLPRIGKPYGSTTVLLPPAQTMLPPYQTAIPSHATATQSPFQQNTVAPVPEADLIQMTSDLRDQLTSLAGMVNQQQFNQQPGNRFVNTSRATFDAPRSACRAEDGRILCNNCHKPGHTARSCRAGPINSGGFQQPRVQNGYSGQNYSTNYANPQEIRYSPQQFVPGTRGPNSSLALPRSVAPVRRAIGASGNTAYGQLSNTVAGSGSQVSLN